MTTNPDAFQQLRSELESWRRRWEEQWGNHNAVITTQTNKFNEQAQQLWNNFYEFLQKTMTDVEQVKVETTNQSTDGKYTTTIDIGGDVINRFPPQVPIDNNAYWKRHNDCVDKIFAERKAIVDTVIKTSGDIIKTLINPVGAGIVTPIASAIGRFGARQIDPTFDFSKNAGSKDKVKDKDKDDE